MKEVNLTLPTKGSKKQREKLSKLNTRLTKIAKKRSKAIAKLESTRRTIEGEFDAKERRIVKKISKLQEKIKNGGKKKAKAQIKLTPKPAAVPVAAPKVTRALKENF